MKNSSILLTFFVLILTSCGTESAPVYTLTTSVNGEGTVTPSSGEYDEGEVVTLTPNPSEGWSFIEWGGDLNGNEAPQQIIIDREKNVTVTFEPTAYLSDNGVTIMCPKGTVGDIGIVDGVEYEVADRNLLEQRRDEGANLSQVCTSLVTDMNTLFKNSSFNQAIGNWDVSNVTDMFNMFSLSTFNQDIGSWDVSNVTDMGFMFDSSPFNQPIGNWDVGNVTNMGVMFQNSLFNQEIGNWDVSNVTRMYSMFFQSSFNQPIGNWDVGNLKDMDTMFYESSFNQDIGNWDVSKVTVMQGMFGSTPFNQDISGWCVSHILSEPSGFSHNSPLIEENKPIWGTCPE